MIRSYRFALYDEPTDLTGQDLISLAGRSRKKVKALIPILMDPVEMQRRWSFTKKVRAANGDIADEVHEFANARQGRFRLQQILFRDGRVIELRYR
jgi:hypothetical protein